MRLTAEPRARDFALPAPIDTRGGFAAPPHPQQGGALPAAPQNVVVAVQ